MLRTTRPLFFLLAVVSLTSCGVASIGPVVTDADVAYDQRLVGTWEDSSEGEFAVITAVGSNSYRVAYTEKDGQTGRFTGRLGRLGSHRVFDLQPDTLVPGVSELYKSLLLRTHAILVIDSIGTTLHFRVLEADSVKAYLVRKPQAVAHAIVENQILLTASPAETRSFLLEFLKARGVLSEPVVWRRRAQ